MPGTPIISQFISHNSFMPPRHTYWKMTNLNRNWGGTAGKHVINGKLKKIVIHIIKNPYHHSCITGRTPSEQKKLFHRYNPSWIISLFSLRKTAIFTIVTIVTIVSQIGSNLLASSPLRPSGLSLWGWQRFHCQGKLSLLGLPRPLLLNDNNPFSNAGARQPRLQVPQLPLQQRRHREGGQAVHGRQRDQSGGWYPLESQAQDQLRLLIFL